jgi:hypothetical protein
MADIRIDTSRLTYTQFLIPELNSWFEGADAPTIRLKPGVYGFQQISGGSGPIFRFEVRPDGLIDYDPANEKFLDGRGATTLNVRGFTITLDGRALSHDLSPLGMPPSVVGLSRHSTHEFTFIPGPYHFRLQANTSYPIEADFWLNVNADGQVVVDPRSAGIATATDRTLTINGHRVTIDGRALSHDLQLVGMVGSDVAADLPRDRTHEFTLIPGAGYRFQPAGGIVKSEKPVYDKDHNAIRSRS